MTSSWLNLVPGSPFCRPCWRWDIANWMVTTGKPVPVPYRDQWVDDAIDFLAAAQSRKRHAVIRDAAHLFSEGPALQRDALEAFLLTGEPVAVVASRCSLSVAITELYGRTFCDVQPRLHARDWIINRVIGPGLWVGFAKENIGSLLRAFGYFAGIHVLDVIVAVCVQDGLVDGANELHLANLPPVDKRLRQKARLAIDASMLPANIKLQQLAGLLAHARSGKARPKTRLVRDMVADHADRVLESIGMM